MRLLTKGLASIVALAVAGSLSMGAVQAAAKADKPAVTATVEKAAGKKAKKAKAKKARVAWKSCGVGKYHDKSGKCVDASAKK
jgi:hypothetical protein